MGTNGLILGFGVFKKLNIDISRSSKFFSKKFLLELTFILLLSWFFALGSRFNIRLPFWGVPFTLQTLVFNLAALTLGYRAVFAYLAFYTQGIFGAPFFTGGGHGILYILGPTGGYLVGFLFMMLFLAITKDFQNKSICWTLGKVAISQLILYFFGLLHLLSFVGVEKVFVVGLYPFWGGMLIKSILASYLSVRFYKSLS